MPNLAAYPNHVHFFWNEQMITFVQKGVSFLATGCRKATGIETVFSFYCNRPERK
jgi:hypothetical protein